MHNSEDVRPYDWSLVNIKDGDKIIKQKTFHFPCYGFGDVSDRINRLKIAEPKYINDFYEIKSDEELKELKKCLLKELQEELQKEEKND